MLRTRRDYACEPSGNPYGSNQGETGQLNGVCPNIAKGKRNRRGILQDFHGSRRESRFKSHGARTNKRATPDEDGFCWCGRRVSKAKRVRWTVFDAAPEQGKKRRARGYAPHPPRLCLRAVGEPKRRRVSVHPGPAPNTRGVPEWAPLWCLVRETGLEPVWKIHTPLKRARLPVPPLPRDE